MTGFQQESIKPTGARHFRSHQDARAAGALACGSKPFVVISHPRWTEFAWVSPPEYALPRTLFGGIQVVEVVQ